MDVVRPARRGARLAKPAAVILAAAAALAGACSLARASAAGSEAPLVDRRTVFTDRVRRGDLLRQIPAQGTLVPERVVWLSATSAGQVAHVVVRAGAVVEPDTVVVVLSNPDLELAALEAERQAASAEAALIQLDVRTDADAKLAGATVASVRADLGDAERHARAADRLAAESLVSGLDRDDAVSKARALAERATVEGARLRVLDAGRARQLAAQRAEVERLREIASFARRRLASLEVRAGIRGVVEDVPLEDGQWVALGGLLAKVAEPDRLKAEVGVAEAEAKDVHRGLPVRFEGAGGAFRGRVERVDPSVAHGAVRVEVTLDDPLPAGARADQTVSGYVEVERLENVLHVTRPAGATDGAPAAVFRLDPDARRATRVTARFGRGSAREVEVAGGLSEGDEIVTSDLTPPGGAPTVRFE